MIARVLTAGLFIGTAIGMSANMDADRHTEPPLKPIQQAPYSDPRPTAPRPTWEPKFKLDPVYDPPGGYCDQKPGGLDCPPMDSDYPEVTTPSRNFKCAELPYLLECVQERSGLHKPGQKLV